MYCYPLQIPPEYGGSSPNRLGQSPEEDALKQLATSLGPTSLPQGAARAVVASESSRHAPATGGGSDDASDHAAAAVSGRSEESEAADEWVASSRHGDDATDGGDAVHADGTGSRGLRGMRALREGSSSVSAAVGAADGGGTSAAGKGMTQRLASAVRRMRGSATRAYLGVENKFRYDTERHMWIIDGDEKDGGVRGDGGGGGRRVPRVGDKEVRE